MIRFLPLLASIALLTPALAADPDPDAVPRIGTVAPAFALYAFEKARDEGKSDPVELDAYCGMRPEETTGVLVMFVDDSNLEDLELANSWHRKFSRQGLAVVAVSQDASSSFKTAVLKANLRFPVLDDRHGIVAARYGVPDAPFSFVLTEECRVVGFSNRTVTADGEALAATLEAQVTGQLGSGKGGFDD